VYSQFPRSLSVSGFAESITESGSGTAHYAQTLDAINYLADF